MRGAFLKYNVPGEKQLVNMCEAEYVVSTLKYR
jgi:hypothetical protein